MDDSQSHWQLTRVANGTAVALSRRATDGLLHWDLFITAVLFIVALLLVLPASIAWRWLTDFNTRLRIPSPRDRSLFLGHLGMLQPHHHRLLLEWAKQCGPVYCLRVGFQQVVVIVDAALINQVLGAKESLSKGLEPDNSDRLMSHRKGHRTLFSADTNGHWWTLIRKGTRGAFVQANVKNGYKKVVEINRRVIKNLQSWGPKQDIDINNVTMRMAMDVTGVVGFAKDFKTTEALDDPATDETFETLKAAMLEAYRCALNPVRSLMFWDKQAMEGPYLFAKFKQLMVELTEEVKARGPLKKDDVSIAAHLMRLADPLTNKPIPDDLLAAEFGVYFAAGIESAGNAMSWTLYLISQHPDVESKLAAELDKEEFLVTDKRPKPANVEYSDLINRLPYLQAVCKEAMRMLPVASSGVTRKTKVAMTLNGFKVPAGSLLLCPIFAAHHLPHNWPDEPDVFKPERWVTDENAELCPLEAGAPADDASRPKRFLPFSTGPRQCIGQNLAKMIHDLGIAMLTAHFTFSLAQKMGGPEGVERTQINRLTLQPGEGLWMRVTPRVPVAPWLPTNKGLAKPRVSFSEAGPSTA